jgi:hypothetical protein
MAGRIGTRDSSLSHNAEVEEDTGSSEADSSQDDEQLAGSPPSARIDGCKLILEEANQAVLDAALGVFVVEQMECPPDVRQGHMVLVPRRHNTTSAVSAWFRKLPKLIS